MNKTIVITLISLNVFLGILNWKMDDLNYKLLDILIDYYQNNLKKGFEYAVNVKYLPPKGSKYMLQFINANNKLDSLYKTKYFFEESKFYLNKYQFKDLNNTGNRIDTAGYVELSKGILKNCLKCKKLYFRKNQWESIYPNLSFSTDDGWNFAHYYIFRELGLNNCDHVFFGSYSSNHLKYIYSSGKAEPLVSYDDKFYIDQSKMSKDSIKIYYPNKDGTKLIQSRLIWY
jgi:hypothetical protein